MAAEAEINVSLTPRLSGVDDLIGQLRRTGAALEGLADSLQALSDGGPDTMRSVPDTGMGGFDFSSLPGHKRMKCPAAVDGDDHDGHEWTAVVPESDGHMATNFVRDCPGHPVRPWHPDSRTT